MNVDTLAEKPMWVDSTRRALLLLGAIVLGAASQNVVADTTTLICQVAVPNVIEDGATTIELNEAQSTVVVHFSANHYINMPTSEEHPSRSIGPFPAQFSNDTITFSDPNPNDYFRVFSISRITGAFVMADVQSNLNGIQNWRWTCHAGQKQF